MKTKKVVANYLRDCAIGLSLSTIDIYRLTLHRFQRHAPRHLERITPDDCRKFLLLVQAGDLRQAGEGPVSRNTLHQHYRSLRTFLAWCCREGILDRSPMENVRAPCQPESATHYLTRTQIGLLLEAATQTQHPVRDYAIVALLLDTGLRREELASLTPGDLSLTERTVTVREGKMHRGRVVPISHTCAAALRAWLAVRPPALSTVFGIGGVNIYHMFYRLRRRVPELAGVSPHVLRHTFATYYGGDIRDTSLIIGHKDISLTAKVYSHKQALSLVGQHDERTPLRLAGRVSDVGD